VGAAVLLLSLTQDQMQVSGQLHTLAAFTLKKSPFPCPLSRRLMGPTACLEILEKRKNSFL